MAVVVFRQKHCGTQNCDSIEHSLHVKERNLAGRKRAPRLEVEPKVCVCVCVMQMGCCSSSSSYILNKLPVSCQGRRRAVTCLYSVGSGDEGLRVPHRHSIGAPVFTPFVAFPDPVPLASEPVPEAEADMSGWHLSLGVPLVFEFCAKVAVTVPTCCIFQK